VANFSLQASSPLNGYAERFGTTSVTELTSIDIYSASLSSDSGKAAVQQALGAPWPAIGSSTQNNSGETTLLGLQQDQIFALVNAAGQSVAVSTAPAIGDDVYVTNQSDSWVALEVEGPMAVVALERICPLDLHMDVFPKGSVARTSMEHLSVIVVCKGQDHYLLLSPSSFARSFLHAVETSFHNVSG